MTWSGASSGEHFVASNPVTGAMTSVNVKTDYGALGMGYRIKMGYANITSGQATVSTAEVTPGSGFTQAMVGWKAIIPAAGDANLNALVTTILSVQDGTHLTLAANAGATLVGGEGFFWPASGAGSNDAAAFSAASIAAGWAGSMFIPSVGLNHFYPIDTINMGGASPSLIPQGQRWLGGSQRGSSLVHTGTGIFLKTGTWCELSNLSLIAGQNTTILWQVLDGNSGTYTNVELDGAANVNTCVGLQMTNGVLNAGGSYFNRFESIDSHHCLYGFHLLSNSTGANLQNQHTFIECRGSQNRDAGWIFQYTQGIICLGCDAEQNGKVGSGPSSAAFGYGIIVQNASSAGMDWMGGWVEGNKNGTLRIEGRPNAVHYWPTASNQYAGDGGGNGFSGIPAQFGSNCEVFDMSSAPNVLYTNQRRTVTNDTGTAMWAEGLTRIDLTAYWTYYTMVAGTDNIIASVTNADGFNRFNLSASGRMVWGSGAAAQDVAFGRQAVGEVGPDSGYKLTTPASSTTRAGLRLIHGAAPTSPADGDMWTTTAGLFVRINGVTKSVNLT